MLYLGGSHPVNMNSCLRISGNESSLEPLLLCYHEEADDRLMYHVNHAIKVDRISKIIIASSDTDVLTCAVYIFVSGCTQIFGSCG